MKKHSVSLADNTEIQQSHIENKDSQLSLRKNYVIDQNNRAICNCNPNENLELVIAYRRETDKFELRRMPGQDYTLHDKDCRFRTAPKLKGESFKKTGLTLAIPAQGQANVSDSKNLQEILSSIWKVFETDYAYRSEESLNWKTVKNELKLSAEEIQVNHKPLIDNLAIVVPKPKSFLTRLNFESGKIILAEFLYAKQVMDGSFMIKVKGSENPIWLSKYRLNDMTGNTKENLLQSYQEQDDTKRQIIAMAVINSSTGGSIQATSIAMIEVDRNTFSHNEK